VCFLGVQSTYPGTFFPCARRFPSFFSTLYWLLFFWCWQCVLCGLCPEQACTRLSWSSFFQHSSYIGFAMMPLKCVSFHISSYWRESWRTKESFGPSALNDTALALYVHAIP
jgi:hypothetical protein